MIWLPINLVNLICEWAAQDDMDRYPFFCPKTHNLSWKINKHSKKLIEKGNIILHNNLDSYIIEGFIDIHNFSKADIDINLQYKGILYKYIDGTFKIYIEVDSERKSNKKYKYIYRAMVKFEGNTQGGMMLGNFQNVYLNTTHYGFICEALFWQENNKIDLYIESF
jgi:hypothetical protein